MNRELIADFAIDGEPISKARARFTNYGGKSRAFTPEKTLAGELNMAAHFRAAAPSHVPDNIYAYEVDATFNSSTRQRRDVDNMLKLVLDGLNKVAWADDNQVTDVHGRKRLVDKGEARTEVRIYRLGVFERRTKACAHCGTEFDTYPSQAARIYCSRECGTAARRRARIATCEQCGDTFERKPSSTARFCSVACKSAAARRPVSCTNCGVQFSKQACHVTDRNYCSAACQQETIRPIRADRARGTCASCGGPTSKKQYTNCQSCALKGVNGKPKHLPEIVYLGPGNKKTDQYMQLAIEQLRPAEGGG